MEDEVENSSQDAELPNVEAKDDRDSYHVPP